MPNRFAKYKPSQTEERSDNTRVVRQPVVKPVKRKLKDGEFEINLPGQKPVIVRSKNAVVKADNRSAAKQQLDWKRDDAIRQKVSRVENNEEFDKLISAGVKMFSPSTYAGAAANSLTNDGSFAGNVMGGAGFGDNTANVVFDMASPFFWKLGVNGVKAGTEFLQNTMPGIFDPYTTFGGSLGYYGNSLFDRFAGTLGRRLHMPTASQMPELMRAEKHGISSVEDLLEMQRLENNARFGRFPWQNMTTDTVVRDHGNGKWAGSDVIIKNPSMYNPQGYLSTQPSDTFVLKGFNLDPNNPKNYTLVSGNTKLLDEARAAGFETLSSPKLRKAYRDIQARFELEESLNGSNARNNFIDLNKGFQVERSEEGKNYTNIIRKLLRKRGQPTYGDYVYQAEQTGLPITVSRTPFTVPGTKIDKVVTNPNLVWYNRATPFESKFRSSLGISGDGVSIADRMKKGYTQEYLRQAAADLNKLLYRRAK